MERPQFPYAQRRAYDPWKSEAGRGRWTRPEDEERRRQAYESAINDDAAAEILGINTPTFAAWRRARGIVSKVAPGQKRHMAQGQFDVLDYLKAHPWTKTYTMAKEMGIHRWTLELRLRALERKDAVDVAMKGRVKHFALVGAEIREGFMRFDRGAPGLFHTGLAQRIVEILRTEPWITKTMIQKRLGALARAKAVEQCLINGYRDGKFTRREVKTSSRRMHAYAQVLRSSRALRSLGYRVDFQMRPIAQADVGAPPPMPSSKNLERSEEPSELDELREED